MVRKATAGDVSKPVPFVINPNNAHWTQATVEVLNGKASYTDCAVGGPPSALSAGLRELQKRMQESKSEPPEVTITPDHASMPRQDFKVDTRSCGPLASFVMHRRAAGLPVAIHATTSTEISAHLRVLQAAAMVAGLMSARDTGQKLWAL
jgi:hypothetical protein